jgi:16S rRNA (cytosine1402-N4)-methyltransferase
METHIPVLYREVLEMLRPKDYGRYLDGTLGAGGHAAGILDLSAPNGRVLGFDRDPEAITYASQKLARYGDRITFVHADYAEMGQLAPSLGFDRLDGILLDLGLSSRQLEAAERGFSFQREGPLDMRFDPKQRDTAADLVNNLTEKELADLFWRYGEERRSRTFARAIIESRPLHTTLQLAEVISNQARSRGRTHPATKVFQALRIATNQELQALERGLLAGIELLAKGARFAIISFHSLEDRIVKRFFRGLSRECICPPEQPVCDCENVPLLKLVTRKAIQASDAEVASNPRSRSARLRVAEKVDANDVSSY